MEDWDANLNLYTIFGNYLTVSTKKLYICMLYDPAFAFL